MDLQKKIITEKFFRWCSWFQYADLNQILKILKKLIVQILDMSLCIWVIQMKKLG